LAVHVATPKVRAEIEKVPERKGYFVTLTVENGPDLVETFTALHEGLGRLQGRIKKQNAVGRGALSNVDGGIGHIEHKRGSGSGLHHPHYHGLWLVRGRLDYLAVNDAWKKATRGRGQVTWCKKVRSTLLRESGASDEAVNDQLVGDMCEIIKYAAKFEAKADPDVWAVADALEGRRLLRTFGCLYRVKVPEHLHDVPFSWAGVAHIERWFEFHADQGMVCVASSFHGGSDDGDQASDGTAKSGAAALQGRPDGVDVRASQADGFPSGVRAADRAKNGYRVMGQPSRAFVLRRGGADLHGVRALPGDDYQNRDGIGGGHVDAGATECVSAGMAAAERGESTRGGGSVAGEQSAQGCREGKPANAAASAASLGRSGKGRELRPRWGEGELRPGSPGLG